MTLCHFMCISEWKKCGSGDQMDQGDEGIVLAASTRPCADGKNL